MKYSVEMGLGAMICIPSFIKFGSVIQKLIGGRADTTWTSYKAAFILSKQGK
jgi:hypothetical protein